MAHLPHFEVREELRTILGMPGASWPELHKKIRSVPSTLGEAERVIHAKEVIADKMDGAHRLC